MTINRQIYMTLTRSTAHGISIDADAMYCVMSRLAVIDVVSQSWTGKPILHLSPTDEGQKEIAAYEAKHGQA